MLAFNNKILTSENCQKWYMQGPGRYIMDNGSEETIDHLFVSCIFSRVVWFKILQISSGKNKREKRSLVDCFHSWILDDLEKYFKALPCYVV